MFDCLLPLTLESMHSDLIGALCNGSARVSSVSESRSASRWYVSFPTHTWSRGRKPTCWPGVSQSPPPKAFLRSRGFWQSAPVPKRLLLPSDTDDS
jgi:hypothetical protein